MEFADIVMELFQRSLAGFLITPCFYSYKRGNLDPAIFRYYLIQDVIIWSLQKPITFWFADKTSKLQERKTLKQMLRV